MANTVLPPRAHLAERDRRSLSEQAAAEIEWMLASGKIQPGSLLPSEIELARLLGISRGTVREALKILEQRHLIWRRRGIGTIAALHPRLRHNLNQNIGVTDLIRSAGCEPDVVRSQVHRRLATSDERIRLELSEASEVVVVERLFTADDAPVVLARDIVPATIMDLGSSAYDGRQSLFHYLHDACGICIAYGVASLRPVKADQKVAHALNVARGTPTLFIDQIDYDQSGHPVLMERMFHNGEAFNVTVLRRGPHTT
jgi:GntR family transcriptional regulator